jgi:hypothetical protein
MESRPVPAADTTSMVWQAAALLGGEDADYDGIGWMPTGTRTGRSALRPLIPSSQLPHLTEFRRRHGTEWRTVFAVAKGIFAAPVDPVEPFAA